jgi:hypothetical protein
MLSDSSGSGDTWTVFYVNTTGTSVDVLAVAYCLGVEPAERLSTAGKRKAALPAGKGQ